MLRNIKTNKQIKSLSTEHSGESHTMALARFLKFAQLFVVIVWKELKAAERDSTSVA